MKVFTHSEPGGDHANEDFLMARRHPGGDERYVCVLADGQGGRSHGAQAAKMACETVWDLAKQRLFDDLLLPGSWKDLLLAADFVTASTGGFTTLATLALDMERALCASCGDTKVYYAPPEGDIVEWTAHQPKNPPVGSGEACFQTQFLPLAGAGRILMMSDGVWKYCGYEALQAAFQLTEFSKASQVLKSAVLSRAGTRLPDGFSVIGIEVQ